MKFILVLLVSLGAFQAQAASRDEKALTKLVVETIDLSELDSALKAQPSDLNQLKITQYRLLWLAGELGYTPQNR